MVHERTTETLPDWGWIYFGRCAVCVASGMDNRVADTASPLARGRCTRQQRWRRRPGFTVFCSENHTPSGPKFKARLLRSADMRMTRFRTALDESFFFPTRPFLGLARPRAGEYLSFEGRSRGFVAQRVHSKVLPSIEGGAAICRKPGGAQQSIKRPRPAHG